MNLYAVVYRSRVTNDITGEVFDDETMARIECKIMRPLAVNEDVYLIEIPAKGLVL